MSDHDPYQDQIEVEEARGLAAIAEHNSALASLQDSCWLATGPRGRRILRAQLRDAGIDLGAAFIRSTFSPNTGHMCFAEGARAHGLNLLAKLVKALATGDLKLEHWKLLVTESD